jgi:hypothetical protein
VSDAYIKKYGNITDKLTTRITIHIILAPLLTKMFSDKILKYLNSNLIKTYANRAPTTE